MLSRYLLLGSITAQYRWFAFIYLSFMFFLFPLSIFALSMAGVIYLSIAGELRREKTTIKESEEDKFRRMGQMEGRDK